MPREYILVYCGHSILAAFSPHMLGMLPLDSLDRLPRNDAGKISAEVAQAEN